MRARLEGGVWERDYVIYIIASWHTRSVHNEMHSIARAIIPHPHACDVKNCLLSQQFHWSADLELRDANALQHRKIRSLQVVGTPVFVCGYRNRERDEPSNISRYAEEYYSNIQQNKAIITAMNVYSEYRKMSPC